MTDRVSQLAFLDTQNDALYFCQPECKRDDREQRREHCSDCKRAARQEHVGALTFRTWKESA